MKVFLRKSLLSTLVVVAFMSCVFLLNRHFFFKYHELTYNNYETLVLGDSRTLCINESIIENSLNFSEQLQTYKNAYYKLRFLSQFNEFDNLILSFSYINFSAEFESAIKHDYTSIQRIYPFISPIELYQTTEAKRSWLKVVSRYVFSFNLNYFGKYLKTAILGIPPNDRSTLPQFQPIEKLKEDKYDYPNLPQAERLAKVEGALAYLYDQDSVHQFKNFSFEYLKKIALLCKEKNIQLHLINMPYDPIFRAKLPKDVVPKFEEIKDIMVEEYKVQYHNYEAFVDNELEKIQDQVHCTPYCASIITEQLLEHLK